MKRIFVVRIWTLLACVAVVAPLLTTHAVPYASKVRVVGTTVTFILNEPADVLKYRINQGPLQTLNGSPKGTKTFSLQSPTDRFAIYAGKNAPVGFTIPTSGTIAASPSGLSVSSAASGLNLISEDLNPLNRFNSLRGVSVSLKPGATNFGTVYIANSTAGTTSGVFRNVGDGLYALNADQTDAFGYGDVAQDPQNYFDAGGASANSPFKITVAPNGEVYVADFSDANSNVYRENPDLTAPGSGVQMLSVIGGPATIPPGQNHGSAMSVYVEGSLAESNLVLYVADEDLRSTGQDDRSSLWRYQINGGPLPSSVMPTRVNQNIVLVPLGITDVNRGKDGKWYLSQNRIVGNEAGIVVLDANGNLLFNSLTISRTILNDPSAVDIMRNTQATAVSEDQKWLAAMINNSFVAVIPLIDGIPDLANRMVVNTGTEVTSGRDIAFDAAGNIHYVSSGQALYTVLAPGGVSWATTAWDGITYTFNVRPVPDLEITVVGNQIKIEWFAGVLQESTNPAGSWVDSANQTSPYLFSPSGYPKFFRLRGTGP